MVTYDPDLEEVQEEEEALPTKKIAVKRWMAREKRGPLCYGDSPYDEYVHSAAFNFLLGTGAIVVVGEGIAKWDKKFIDAEARIGELHWLHEDQREVVLALRNGYLFVKPGT